MKKILCLVFSIILCISFLSPSLYAAEAAKELHDDSYLNAVTFSCVYDVEAGKVVIDGNIQHDFMISHNDYTMKIYAVPPGQSVESIISSSEVEPHVEADITMKFTFSIKVGSIHERYSKYAIVLCSPDGSKHLAGQPLLPSISSSFEYDAADRTHYKGILTDNPVDIGYSGGGTVVVDIDIGKTVGDAADSILYPMGDSYIHIRKSYITHIDKQIMSASLSGSRVYVRLLLSAGYEDFAASYSTEENTYSIPNLYSEEVLEYVSTLSGFLAERYNGDKGEICGVILGTMLDNTLVNMTGSWSAEEYAERYTLYLVVVGNALRAVRTDFDIVIPLSDRNDYSSNQYADYDIRASVLLEKIIYMLDENVSGDFNCSVMIESDYSPLSFSSYGEGNSLQHKDNQAYIACDNIGIFINYLQSLSNAYMSVPTNVIYMWSPECTLQSNALLCTYIYNYARLAENSTVSSFVANLNKTQFDTLRRVIRNIDTENADSVNLPIAEYFGFDSWNDILSTEVNLPTTRTLFECGFFKVKPDNIKSEFQYMDFTLSETYSLMSVGHNCTYIRSEYNSQGERMLSVISSVVSLGDSVQAVGAFEYPESYEYTEYMSICAQIKDEKASDAALYEITLTLGMGADEISASGVVQNNELCTLFFDIGSISNVPMADYIKISARPLTENSEGFSLCVEDLRGYSTIYEAQELESLIQAKQLQIRNQNIDDDGGFNYTLLMTIIGIVFALSAVAVGLLIVFKRDEDADK